MKLSFLEDGRRQNLCGDNPYLIEFLVALKPSVSSVAFNDVYLALLSQLELILLFNIIQTPLNTKPPLFLWWLGIIAYLPQ